MFRKTETMVGLGLLGVSHIGRAMTLSIFRFSLFVTCVCVCVCVCACENFLLDYGYFTIFCIVFNF